MHIIGTLVFVGVVLCGLFWTYRVQVERDYERYLENRLKEKVESEPAYLDWAREHKLGKGKEWELK